MDQEKPQEFGAANRLAFNADLGSKVLALAADYFKKGKTVDWVLDNACGTHKHIRRSVILMAESQHLISRSQADALRERYGLKKKNG